MNSKDLPVHIFFTNKHNTKHKLHKGLGLWYLTPFQQYFSYIIVESVLLMEETRVSRENHRPAASYLQTLSHNVVSSTQHQWR